MAKGHRTLHEHVTRHKIFFGESIVVVVSYLVHYDTNLQNVTDMTKRNCFIITKCIRFIVTKDDPETVVQSCSVNKVFLKNSQNSQENTSARVF